MTSLLGNKILYQASIGVAALMQALANAGYSPNDGSADPALAFENLVGVMQNIVTLNDLSNNNFVSLAPAQASTLNLTPLSVNVQAYTEASRLVRVTAGYRCVSAPSTISTSPVIVINGVSFTPGFVFPTNARIGDFVRVALDIVVTSPTLVNLYSVGQGVLVGAAVNPSIFLAGASTFGNLFNAFQVKAGINGLVSGSGLYSIDYLLAESIIETP